jgi:hypothetical protein
MNTQILRRFDQTERAVPNVFVGAGVLCAGVFSAVLGALAALGVVYWAFETIIRLITHQV